MAALAHALLDTQFKTTDADQSHRELYLISTPPHLQAHPATSISDTSRGPNRPSHYSVTVYN